MCNDYSIHQMLSATSSISLRLAYIINWSLQLLNPPLDTRAERKLDLRRDYPVVWLCHQRTGVAIANRIANATVASMRYAIRYWNMALNMEIASRGLSPRTIQCFLRMFSFPFSSSSIPFILQGNKCSTKSAQWSDPG